VLENRYSTISLANKYPIKGTTFALKIREGNGLEENWEKAAVSIPDCHT
jgi:hypothetical protein